ncbi:hypothetical protein GCM10009845_34680 [Pedococcus bigeumensis]
MDDQGVGREAENGGGHVSSCHRGRTVPPWQPNLNTFSTVGSRKRMQSQANTAVGPTASSPRVASSNAISSPHRLEPRVASGASRPARRRPGSAVVDGASARLELTAALLRVDPAPL